MTEPNYQLILNIVTEHALFDDATLCALRFVNRELRTLSKTRITTAKLLITKDLLPAEQVAEFHASLPQLSKFQIFCEGADQPPRWVELNGAWEEQAQVFISSYGQKLRELGARFSCLSTLSVKTCQELPTLPGLAEHLGNVFTTVRELDMSVHAPFVLDIGLTEEDLSELENVTAADPGIDLEHLGVLLPALQSLTIHNTYRFGLCDIVIRLLELIPASTRRQISAFNFDIRSATPWRMQSLASILEQLPCLRTLGAPGEFRGYCESTLSMHPLQKIRLLSDTTVRELYDLCQSLPQIREVEVLGRIVVYPGKFVWELETTLVLHAVEVCAMPILWSGPLEVLDVPEPLRELKRTAFIKLYSNGLKQLFTALEGSYLPVPFAEVTITLDEKAIVNAQQITVLAERMGCGLEHLFICGMFDRCDTHARLHLPSCVCLLHAPVACTVPSQMLCVPADYRNEVFF